MASWHDNDKLEPSNHHDVIKWKHFPRYWPFVRSIHRPAVNSPAQRPVTRSFDVFFVLHLNKRLSKQSWGWWFEAPSRPLWRHCKAKFYGRPSLLSFPGHPSFLGVLIPNLPQRQYDAFMLIAISCEKTLHEIYHLLPKCKSCHPISDL